MKALITLLLILSISNISMAGNCAEAVGPEAKRLAEKQEGDGVVIETVRVKRGSITTFEEVEVGESPHFEEFDTGDSSLDVFGGL